MRSPRVDHEGESPQTFFPLVESPHTPNYRQRQPLLANAAAAPAATSRSPAPGRRDDDRWKKDATTLTQKRQRQCIVITLLTLIVLYLVTQRLLMKSPIHSSPYPSTPLVPNSPKPPSPDSPTVPIITHPIGVMRDYQLPAAAFSNDPTMPTTFTVYLPTSLRRMDAQKHWSTLPASDDQYHSYPLVLSLHGRTGNSSTECAHWKFYAEANQWIVVCPTMGTSARAQYATIDHSVVFLTAVMDSVLGDAKEGVSHASTPSLSLTRLVDRKRILLTGHSGGGYSLTAFALLRPNYWTALAARSTNFWQHHFEAKLLPATTQLAIDALEKDEWHLPKTHPAGAVADGRPSNAHIAEVFWTEMLKDRPVLFQRGDQDHKRVVDHMEAMHDALRNYYGIRHVAVEVMQEEKHESRIDNTARWWAKKHISMKIGAKP